MEEVLFETERRTDRAEIAALLRDVADRLDSAEPVTLSSGDDSITLEIPDRPEFEVKVERESGGSRGSRSELSVEFELEWDEDDGGSDGALSVE